MKKYAYYFIIIILSLTAVSCDDTWNEHYSAKPDTVDQSVWEKLKSESDASKFVALVEEVGYDSLFEFNGVEYNDVFTLFVPSNKAIENFEATSKMNRDGVAYHILRHFIQPDKIVGKKKVQTLLLKFAQFENKNNQYLFDEVPVSYTSPLYENGRYFIIDQVAVPKPSLYEYITVNNPALKKYIDDQDSIILDKELSKPIDFDDEGKTIYDSVITVINLFEEEFFEVSEEFRLKTATLVFPKKQLYEEALTKMALKIGGGYTNHEDIAEEWQQDILIPFLLEKGIFENQREPFEFQRDTLKNIIGDDVILNYRPVNKTICSNGYAYDYNNFTVEDSLFLDPLRNEGEWLLMALGLDRFAWNEDVSVASDETFVPNADFVFTASNDSILKVNFPKGYEGQFKLEFNSKPLFPRRYLMVVRTHMDFGGLYEIYVNDELVKTFDYYDFARYKGVIPSSVPGIRFIADGRYNKFDFWVDNITEYGEAKIRFEYKGPSKARYNGLVLDYIDCVPEEMTHTITKNP